jgi:mannitol-1-phosphate/altronate dehydrogenase
MVNPYLNDLVARICRDPVRKLGYSDRLFGAMREALRQGIRPAVLARGAFGGLVYLVEQGGGAGVPAPADSSAIDSGAIARMLTAIWRNEETDRYADECVRLVQDARAACNPS